MDQILYLVVLMACMTTAGVIGYVCGYERCRGQYRKIIDGLFAKRGGKHATKIH